MLTHPATTLQQAQSIEALKDLNGGLVDGDHDSAAIPGDVLHRTHHNGSCPSIKPCRIRTYEKQVTTMV